MSDLALPIRSPPELALAGRLSSDERLARLVSKGSTRAFAVLYQRHHQALYGYCRSIVRNEEDAQDALQSTMTRALLALRSRERDLAVRPWLFRIAHNEAVSILRRRQPTVDLVEELEPAELTVERAQEGRERLEVLVADLQALPERQRSALVMRELSGLSIEEIAGALSTSPGAAKQLLFEARSALHEFVEGRAMECEQVRRAISDGDRRVLRGRRLRGHLRGCRGCRDFQAAIPARSADLRVLAPPLPGMAATALLGRLLAHGVGGGHSGSLLVGSGSAVGNTAAASLTVKALATVAVATVAVAGGARLALVHGRHGQAPGTGTQVGPAVTGHAHANGTAPPLATSGADPATALGAGAAAGAHYGTSPIGGAGNGTSRGGAGDGASGAHGSPATAPGAGRAAAGRGIASQRSHAGKSKGRSAAGSSRPAHPNGGARKRPPTQPAKPGPQRGSSGEPGVPVVPIPAGAGSQRGEAGAQAQQHGAPAGASPAPFGSEGPASSAAGPRATRSG